jgi:hypothetical protein
MNDKSQNPDNQSGQTRQKPTTSEGDPVDGTGEDNHTHGSPKDSGPGSQRKDSASKDSASKDDQSRTAEDKDKAAQPGHVDPGHVEKAPRGKESPQQVHNNEDHG